MAVKSTYERPSIEELIRSQEELLEQARQSLAKVRKGEAVDPELSIQLKETRLGRVQKRLEKLEEAKKRAVERYDREIERHQETGVRLEREIAEERERLKAPPDVGDGGGKEKGGELTRINGLGPKRALKLEQNGITTVAQVAELAPDQLAGMLSISAKAAAAIVADAKRILDG